MILKSQLVTTLSSTITDTVVSLVEFGFSAAVVQGADQVIISVTANALRLTYDSPAANGDMHPPTTSTGLKLPTSNYPLYVLEGRTNAQNLRMCRDSSGSATVTITIESN